MNITRFNYPMGCLTNLGSFESQLAPGKWEKVGKWMNWIDLVKCQHALRLLCNEKCETGGNFRFRFRITRVCTIQHKSRDREKGFWKKKKTENFLIFFFLNFNKKEMSRVCGAVMFWAGVARLSLFFFPAFSIPLLAVILDPSPEFKNHLQPFHIWCNFTFTL